MPADMLVVLLLLLTANGGLCAEPANSLYHEVVLPTGNETQRYFEQRTVDWCDSDQNLVISNGRCSCLDQSSGAPDDGAVCSAGQYCWHSYGRYGDQHSSSSFSKYEGGCEDCPEGSCEAEYNQVQAVTYTTSFCSSPAHLLALETNCGCYITSAGAVSGSVESCSSRSNGTGLCTSYTMVKTQNATTIDEMALFSSGCYAECDEGFERQTTSTGSTTCCQVGQSCVDETSASGSASATGADTDDTTDAADGDAKWSTFAAFLGLCAAIFI